MSVTLELANTPKLRPRTKHLAVQLHHFRQYILNKTIAVEKVDTKYQRADIMTKALPRDSFQFLRKTITGDGKALRGSVTTYES